MDSNLAVIHGPNEPALCLKTMGNLIDDLAIQFRDRPALVVPWQSVRLSYHELAYRSKVLAHSLLKLGLRRGDCVGIMAGNCYEYIEVFLGGARIGCPVVVFNNTYTPSELKNAARTSCCKLLFHSTNIGARDLLDHIETLRGSKTALADLRCIVSLGQSEFQRGGIDIQSYSEFTSNGRSAIKDSAKLQRVERIVTPEDVINLQFTSGTTGSPKAAMLTNINLINNALFTGQRMHLTPEDIICCPTPMFHCFGLVIGFLTSYLHGSSVVFPADYFDVKSVVNSIMSEDCTAILGVPTMYLAELEHLGHTRQKPNRLRVGIIGGTTVPPDLMKQIEEKMGVGRMLIVYGMTETSPVSFLTSLEDNDEKQKGSVGRLIPHVTAKVIDERGKILNRGERGELCTSGFILQKGYWKNEEKTNEVMRRDENGVLWMHTGDEAMIDTDGYAHITGRIKDIIIRGGENVFPREIEEHLMCHTSIDDASVVGIKDDRYGEAVGCFLQLSGGSMRPSDHEIRKFVSEKLGRHKAPTHVFWLGDPGVGVDFPKTGSGKHQKHMMRTIGNRLVGKVKAKL